MGQLISVDEALDSLLERVPAPRTADVAVEEACGLVLAGDVVAGEDHPPFRRSRVDGYAVRAGDLTERAGEETLLEVAFEVAAGAYPERALGAGEAARVFTGAPVPDGADVVVMQERCTRDGAYVRVPGPQPAGRNVTPRAAECAAGTTVASAGDVVTAALSGVLASVGAARVRVHPAPTARVLATGDELVPVEQTPGPGQIRNSNAVALVTALRRLGASVVGHGRTGDDPTLLDAAVQDALQADVAVITGGVSVGDYDLVPAALAGAHVQQVFHGVRLQPGKPLYVGVHRRCIVFGLPGNPVSALVNAELFIRPAVRKLRGLPPDAGRTVPARLGGPLAAGTWRRRYDPVALSRDEAGTLIATPVRYRGSGDIFGFARADALAMVRERAPAAAAGDPCAVVPLEIARS